MKEQIEKLRDELYEAIPTGEMNAFDLIRVIKDHINKLDALTEVNNNIVLPDVSGRSEQLKCEHDPVSLKGKYTNCKHCTTILQLKPRAF